MPDRPTPGTDVAVGTRRPTPGTDVTVGTRHPTPGTDAAVGTRPRAHADVRTSEPCSLVFTGTGSVPCMHRDAGAPRRYVGMSMHVYWYPPGDLRRSLGVL